MRFNKIKKIDFLFGSWLFIILVLSVIPLDQETKIELGGTPFRLDYFEHFAIYFILGLASLIYLVRFVQAWQESNGAVFGLEADSAKKSLNRSVVSLFILAVNIFVVFISDELERKSLEEFVLLIGL